MPQFPEPVGQGEGPRRARQAWHSRWSTLLACSAARAVALSLLEGRGSIGADGDTPSTTEVLAAQAFSERVWDFGRCVMVKRIFLQFGGKKKMDAGHWVRCVCAPTMEGVFRATALGAKGCQQFGCVTWWSCGLVTWCCKVVKKEVFKNCAKNVITRQGQEKVARIM